jgi:hypothetical protein
VSTSTNRFGNISIVLPLTSTKTSNVISSIVVNQYPSSN